MSIKKKIHHVHDKSYRSFFENKEIFLELLQSFVKEKWTTQLPVVVPIVLYNGAPEWEVTTLFKEKLQQADLFGNHTMNFEYSKAQGYTSRQGGQSPNNSDTI